MAIAIHSTIDELISYLQGLKDCSKIISGSNDRTIKIWNMSTGECEQTLKGHDGWVTSVCVSLDGSKIISGSVDNTIKIWNMSTGECEQTLNKPNKLSFEGEWTVDDLTRLMSLNIPSINVACCSNDICVVGTESGLIHILQFVK